MNQRKENAFYIGFIFGVLFMFDTWNGIAVAPAAIVFSTAGRGLAIAWLLSFFALELLPFCVEGIEEARLRAKQRAQVNEPPTAEELPRTVAQETAATDTPRVTLEARTTSTDEALVTDWVNTGRGVLRIPQGLEREWVVSVIAAYKDGRLNTVSARKMHDVAGVSRYQKFDDGTTPADRVMAFLERLGMIAESGQSYKFTEDWHRRFPRPTVQQ